MRVLTVALGLLILALMPAATGAQEGDFDTEDLGAVMEQLFQSSFLTVECPVPSRQPKLTELRRSWSPSAEELIDRFLGSREAVMEEESITSPLWGAGKCYKSGMVLYLMDRDVSLPQDIGGIAREVEVVPTFLNVYSTGFVYENNIPHKAVYATDVEVTSESSADVSYYFVYREDEGRQAVRKLIGETFGELTVPPGFAVNEAAIVQDYGERLFVYRAQLEYITEYNVYENTAQVVGPEADPSIALPEARVIGTEQIKVPVFDVYTHVLLDGDKLLTAMEYFWDAEIKPEGEPRECIHAGNALFAAREKLFAHFAGTPPLMTVTDIRIGFIQDRADHSRLVPVWFFDAWYTETVSAQEVDPQDVHPITSPYARNIVYVPFPFAIDALTEELYVL
jgi:hypothetical protein